MSDADIITIFIRGVISGLPEDQRIAIGEAAKQIRQIVEDNGDYGQMALALVGAEMAAKESR